MKSTKNKLLSSIATMCVCFAMLIGSTYAWFTDTASTGVNKIQAGNLDVQLLVYKDSGYVDVEADPNTPLSLFNVGTSNVAQNNNSDTLWEPGKTQVSYLKIKNNGNLDLKYKAVVEVVNPPESKDLYKVMQYEIIPNATPSNKVTAWGGSGKSIVVGNNATESVDVVLKKNEEHDFALAIHMDENAGNTYKEGKVEFYIHVYAAQLTSESDSFNDQYDVNAQYPVELNARVSVNPSNNTVRDLVTVSTAEMVAGTRNPVATVTVPVGVKMESGKNTVTTSITQTSTPSSMASNISVTSDSKTFEVKAEGVSTENDQPLTVKAYIGTGLSNVKLYHDGVVMADKTDDPSGLVNNHEYEYDSSTGYITFLSKNFSPFTATYDKDTWAKHASIDDLAEKEGGLYEIGTAEDLAKFAKMVNEDRKTFANKTVKLISNVDLGNYLWVPVGQTGATQFQGIFDGQGYTISNMTVNNTDVSSYCASGFFGWIEDHGQGIVVKNVNFENAYVEGNHNVGVVCGYIYGTIEKCKVNNSTVVANNANDDANGDKVAGIVGYVGEDAFINNNVVSNCSIKGNRDIGGIAGAVANGVDSFAGNAVSNTMITYMTGKSYASAGEIVSGRTGFIPDESNIHTSVTVSLITE